WQVAKTIRMYCCVNILARRLQTITFDLINPLITQLSRAPADFSSWETREYRRRFFLIILCPTELYPMNSQNNESLITTTAANPDRRTAIKQLAAFCGLALSAN